MLECMQYTSDKDYDPCIEDLLLPECEPLPPLPDRDCYSSYHDRCISLPLPNLNCDNISSAISKL